MVCSMGSVDLIENGLCCKFIVIVLQLLWFSILVSSELFIDIQFERVSCCCVKRVCSWFFCIVCFLWMGLCYCRLGVMLSLNVEVWYEIFLAVVLEGCVVDGVVVVGDLVGYQCCVVVGQCLVQCILVNVEMKIFDW